MWPTEGAQDKEKARGWSSLDRRGRALALSGVGILAAALVATTWLSIMYGRGAGPVLYGQTAAPATLWLWDGTAFRSQVITYGPRSNDADMAFDPGRNELVVWDHGCGRLVMGFTGGCVDKVNQTWTWDGASWTARPAHTTPSAIGQGTAFYDPQAGRVAYVNGEGEMWTWSGSDWFAATLPGGPLVPPPGSASAPASFAAGFDGGRGLLVYAVSDGTWTWDGASWTRHAGGIPATEAAAGPQLIYDAADSRLVHIGSTRTWTWDGAVWASTEQPAVASGAAAYDPALKGVLSVAQDSKACDRGSCRSQTRLWNPGGWRAVGVAGGPAFELSRSGASPPSMVYDPSIGAVVLFLSAA